MSHQPNVLFIILDTMRRDRLSLYGHHQETSPNLDAFAQDATIFERAVAPAQWTIPAHSSFFTGLYPSEHQLTQAFHQLSGNHPTLAEILQVDGYHTVAFCNNPLLGVLDHGLQRGFGAFYNYAGASPNRPVDMTRSAIRRQMATGFRRIAQRVTNQFARSDWMFNIALNPMLVPLWTRFANFKGDTARSVDDLIDYWQSYHAGGSEQPIFAFLNLMGTHTPYQPPADLLDQFSPGLRQDRHAMHFMAQHNANAAEWLNPLEKPLEDWQMQAMDGFYNAEIAHQDLHLGRLFQYLEQTGDLDNTMVIIMADHGEGHGEHGFKGHSFVVFQELVHVPLLIRYPDHFPAGKHVTTNISTRRLFHTVLDYTGITPPLAEDDPNANITDLSLRRALNGKPDPEGGVVYAEAFPPVNLLNNLENHNPQLIEQLHLRQVRRGVYDGDHKLAMVGAKVESFFDVAQDPGEAHDVAAQHPARVSELQAKLDAFVESVTPMQAAGMGNGQVSDDVMENLRALGYIE